MPPFLLPSALLGVGLVVAALIGVSSVWAGDDLQGWATVELKKRLNAQWEAFVIPEVRIRDTISELFYHESRQGVRWTPNPHWTVGLNYLFARNASTGKPLDEHTGELDVTPKMTVGPLEGAVRGRLALRTIEGSAGEQEFQVRLMPRIAYPTHLGPQKLTPYVADDLFYDYTARAWNQHRVFLGVAIPFGKTLGAATTLDLYYMAQNTRSARKDWTTNHVLGTKLTLVF